MTTHNDDPRTKWLLSNKDKAIADIQKRHKKDIHMVGKGSYDLHALDIMYLYNDRDDLLVLIEAFREQISSLEIELSNTKQFFKACSDSEFHQRTVDLPVWRDRAEKAENRVVELEQKLQSIITQGH